MNAELIGALGAAQMALMGYTHQNDITRAALAQVATALANAKSAKKPVVFVSLNADDNEFSVFAPNAIADTFEVSFLEVDDPAPASLYHSHGAKHDAETHEELCNNADYRRTEA